MTSCHVYQIRQSSETQRSFGAVGFLNTSPAMVALLDRPGDRILVRDAGTSRDQVYLQAKKYGRKVSIRKIQLILGDRVYPMFEVELIEIDDDARCFGVAAEGEE